MAGSTLFGYTVEEDEGKLVITLTGMVAETLLNKYTAEGVGQDPRILSALLPFGQLGSRPVVLRPHMARDATKAKSPEQLDLKDIFGQGFDRSHSEFEAQLSEYRDLLGAAAPQRRAAAAPPARAAARAVKRAAKRSGRRK